MTKKKESLVKTMKTLDDAKHISLSTPWQGRACNSSRPYSEDELGIINERFE